MNAYINNIVLSLLIATQGLFHAGGTSIRVSSTGFEDSVSITDSRKKPGAFEEGAVCLAPEPVAPVSDDSTSFPAPTRQRPKRAVIGRCTDQ